jgi:hypothetical protein
MSVAGAVGEALEEARPLLEDLFGLWLSQGKDPKAELKAMLDGAELAAIRLERAKFGGG